MIVIFLPMHSRNHVVPDIFMSCSTNYSNCLKCKDDITKISIQNPGYGNKNIKQIDSANKTKEQIIEELCALQLPELVGIRPAEHTELMNYIYYKITECANECSLFCQYCKRCNKILSNFKVQHKIFGLCYWTSYVRHEISYDKNENL